jgi:ABC-type branched-subunit amino acid transport system ATPase component
VNGLAVDNVRVRFGGLVAVDGVSLTAPQGRITGLIGPNGAGKTTLFNACSGLVRPQEGRIRLDDEGITHLSVPARSRRGLGRTFQRMELFDSLTVVENVSLGREAGQAGGAVLRHLVARPADREEARTTTADTLELCGIVDIAGRTVGALSTGQRRLVELARTLAGRFSMLLLDEPSSGLDHVETDAFGQILRRAVAERGLGILLVEHDMGLVMGTCEHIHVVDFGRPIFEGTPAEVQGSDAVRAAYLGSDAA